VSFDVDQSTLGSYGGTVRLTGIVQHATTCTFKVSPALDGLPDAGSCDGGAFGLSVAVPANATAKSKTYTFRLEAAGIGPVVWATPVTVTVAPMPPPSVVAVAVSAEALGPGGGTVQVMVHVANATTCTFKVSPALDGLPEDVPCDTGSATVSVSLPANATKKARAYTFKLTASGVGKSATADSVPVTVAARA
jgi:hypothetical protein